MRQGREGKTNNENQQEGEEMGLGAENDTTGNKGGAEAGHVAGALARRDASYEAAKGRLQAVCDDFGRSLETPPTDNPTFIEGRVADVLIDGDPVGVIGEVHPAVLVDHDLEVPVAAFEFALDGLR